MCDHLRMSIKFFLTLCLFEGLLFCFFLFAIVFCAMEVIHKMKKALNHNNGVIIICECQIFKINFKMHLLWDIQNLMFSICSTWFNLYMLMKKYNILMNMFFQMKQSWERLPQMHQMQNSPIKREGAIEK